MKKPTFDQNCNKAIIFLCCFLLSTKVLYAQESAAKMYKHATRFEFFGELGYYSPKGAYADNFRFDENAEISEALQRSVEGDTGGFGATQGFSIKVGGNFYIGNGSEKLNGGIRVTLLGYHNNNFKWETDSDYIFKNASYNKPRYFSFLVGPFFRYKLNENISLRLYYQAGIRSANKGGWTYAYSEESIINTTKTVYDDEAEFYLGKGNGLVQEAGLHVAYRRYYAGISYTWGYINYTDCEFKRNSVSKQLKYDAVDDEYVETGASSFFSNEFFDAKAPVKYLSISIGYVFAKSRY